MLTILAIPAIANDIDMANVSLSCSNYQICVAAENLNTGQNYTITYQITVMPSSGTPMTISNSIPFTASGNTFGTCITQALGPLMGNNSFSGSATLKGFNTIPDHVFAQSSELPNAYTDANTESVSAVRAIVHPVKL
jgi:hypothetical protein